MKNRVMLVFLAVLLSPGQGCGNKRVTHAVDSIRLVQLKDSMRRLRFDEVGFIIDQIERSYVSGRRGLSEEEWNKGLDSVFEKLDVLYWYDNEYMYVWRYLGLLLDDAHFAFPDDGSLSRYGALTEKDVIFPLWVQTWTDGTVYNVKDYTERIPRHARILSVNGRSAQDLALMSRAVAPGEEAYAMANMNARYEPEPGLWPGFANFLFMARINSPYKVVYLASDSDRPDTVILKGMLRKDKAMLYRTTGDKRRSKNERGFPRKPVVYRNAGGGIGVLSVNSFWGKRWSAMLLFGKDWRYKRLLRRAMKRIDRDGIRNLIVDVSLNSGGMTENVYRTLDYFTDKPVDIVHKYLITDDNRELAQTNVSRSPYIPEADRNYLTGYIDTVACGTLFRTDTLRPIRYIPGNPKHKYEGNVYVLTSHQTYSAGQMFARYCQTLGIGPVAGQHCGGYNEITGNAVPIPLPATYWVEFKVPFSAVIVCPQDSLYDYPRVDIPIEQPFGEWLRRENRSLERLAEMIRTKNSPEKF